MFSENAEEGFGRIDTIPPNTHIATPQPSKSGKALCLRWIDTGLREFRIQL